MVLSVIIPTYQPAQYLYECLKCLDNQDIDKKLFEVIIVLNGPKEPYYSILSNWLKEMSFNHSLVYSEDAGVSNARNLGIDTSNFDYLMFIDDDDIISDDYLSFMLNNRITNGILVSSTYQFEKEISNISDDYLTFKLPFISDNLLSKRKFLSNACCKLIPKNLIGDVRFNKNLKLSEDAVFMFEISKNLKYIKSTDPNIIYYRRIRENSASRKKRNILSNFFNLMYICRCFTFIYLKDPANYSLLLYTTRILASIKRFILLSK